MDQGLPRDLREYFSERLPHRLREVEDAWCAVRESGWGPEPVKRLHRLAHSLAGTGSTFGFPTVSGAARGLEVLLQGTVEGTAPPPDAGRVEELLSELRKTLEPSSSKAGAGLAPGQAETGPVRPSSLGTERLLFLVEDDPELGQTLAHQLHHFGYQVRLFPDIASFEREIVRELPAVVLMDVMFPEGRLAGAERIRALRETYGEALKVIFLSSRGDLAARLEAVRARGDAYFTKPIDVSALVDTLDRLTEIRPMDPYRILLVEDDPDLAAFSARALEDAGMVASVVSDPMEVMGPLGDLEPDVILMDLYMPGCTGPELAAVLRQQERWVGTPIVFLSTEEGLEKQIAAINAGGDEFLTKPIAPAHLAAALAARARRGRLLGSLISYDGLTGLLNHGNLKVRLESELALAARERWEVAYAMVDLDRFKSINDEHGHATGDRLLRNLAMLLKQRLRRSDVVGRYGGDEFAVIFPHTDGATARRVLEDIRESFSRLPHSAGDREITTTLSCGVAVYPAHPTAETLAEAADVALYAAKRSGRNRVELRGAS
ncbi:MAG TPA: diguanylate cyclase [Thermoanaerobaculia bacterium]|nr:diguanylate cyclase [Thermoanaerobaculia bacterium]